MVFFRIQLLETNDQKLIWIESNQIDSLWKIIDCHKCANNGSIRTGLGSWAPYRVLNQFHKRKLERSQQIQLSKTILLFIIIIIVINLVRININIPNIAEPTTETWNLHEQYHRKICIASKLFRVFRFLIKSASASSSSHLHHYRRYYQNKKKKMKKNINKFHPLEIREVLLLLPLYIFQFYLILIFVQTKRSIVCWHVFIDIKYTYGLIDSITISCYRILVCVARRSISQSSCCDVVDFVRRTCRTIPNDVSISHSPRYYSPFIHENIWMRFLRDLKIWKNREKNTK